MSLVIGDGSWPEIYGGRLDFVRSRTKRRDDSQTHLLVTRGRDSSSEGGERARGESEVS